MGGELGDETYAGVPLVSFALPPPIFHLDREHRYLYEFSVEKFVLLSFREYLGEIESGKKKVENFHIRFFGHVQCCVSVSDSNFQVLIR